jgi:agmatinase
MKKQIKKYPPIPQERLDKYQDLWKNSTSREGVHPDLKAHFERVKTMGDGKGIEFLSNINKDYLGAFMAPFSQDLENADIAVIGMPFEKSAPMNASHKYGPKVLRELSKNFMGTTEPWINGEFDIPFDFANIIDYGTIYTYGQFDAHYDLGTEADFPYPYHSGNMFTQNFAKGNVDPERMIQIGIRGRMTGLVGGHAKNFGTNVVFADEARIMTPREMADQIIEVVGDGPTYISLDLDCLDPVFNSASSAVEPFGLDANWIYDVLKLVRMSGKVNLVGADVVEYAPQNDPARTFGYIAAGLSWKILCWLAADVKRRNGGVNHPTVWDMALGNVTL